MAKIGIVDVDSTSFPNLALMKIAAYHKSLGDVVEWASPLFADYDKVYLSKVFTFTPDYPYAFDCEVERGGTGYDLAKKLPDCIDRQQPDYSIYGITDTAYGYHGSVFTYCLLNDFRETIERINYLRGLSWVVPHCQPYRDFNNPRQVIPQWQKDLARWANMRAIYNTVELRDYEPRKGFKFGKYFDL